jgi:hypothetical protein
MKTKQQIALFFGLVIGSIVVPMAAYATMCLPPAAIIAAYVTVPALSIITLISLIVTLPFIIFKKAEFAILSRQNKIKLLTFLVIGSTSILFGSLSLANSANVIGDDINKTVLYFLFAIITYFMVTIFYIRRIFNQSKVGIRISSTIILAPILVTSGLLLVFYLIGNTYAQTVAIPKNSELFGCLGVPDTMWITEGIKGVSAYILASILSIFSRKITNKMIVSPMV